ncbi:MAG TPA: hemerythrin domain-containing protein [Arenimonas sp.]
MSETIYEALRESHEIQRSLCRRLLRTSARGDDRQEIFTQLRIELAAHAASEERYLYAPLLMHDGGLDASRHALHEHHEIDELVEKLLEGEPSDRGWMNTARALSHQVHHHLREEEKKFFQVSGKLLTQAQKTKLAGQYRRDLQRMRKLLAED